MSTDYALVSGQTNLAVSVTTNDVAQQGLSVANNPGIEPDLDAPLPRPKRKSRRAKEDRGLPPDAELAKLATAYLERQRKHWPDIAEAGLLPAPDDDVLDRMVEDFKQQHRTGKVDPHPIRAFLKFAQKLGGNYNRFSCDNSSPLSIIDQMGNVLDKARAEDRFIPWAYIFCDYSVTGLNPTRQGYMSYKGVLAEAQHLETTYIDDFTRASRDELEWWKLAHLSKRLKKRMIGASDGFDVGSPNCDLMITLYSLLSRLFMKSLCEKVQRGMKGAARRGTCLGKLPLGFTRQVCRDANGQTVYRPDGRPRHKPCIDPATQPYRLEMFELYVHKSWSPYKIAKHFNRLRVDGSNGWTGSAIKKLLAGIDAIGIFVWNRKRREYDYDQEKHVTVLKPRSEWEIYKDPSLALVPKELWRAAWLKLLRTRKAHPLTGKKWSRNQNAATTLFSGTLFCAYCNSELRLNHSDAKYKNMACLSGSTGVHDCTLTTSKSLRIIEECLLRYLGESLLTEETVAELIQKTNDYLEREAKKPRVDAAPKRAKIRDYNARIQKLVAKVEKEPDETLCEGYHTRIKALQKEVNELKAAVREAEVRNQAPPKPLDAQRAKAYLADLRALLNQEIPMAAEAIRTLTGPIKIRQEIIPGKPGARWIATFSPDLPALLRKVARDKGYRETASLAAAIAEARPVEVVIDKVFKYERLAPLFKQLEESGASIQTIASAHKMAWQEAKAILDFAKTGRRPRWRKGKGRRTGRGQKAKFQEIEKEVAHLRDVVEMPFGKIAAQLGVSLSTVRRAYDSAHQDEMREAAKRGETPDRKHFPTLGNATHERIREMVRQGVKDAEIAAVVGCGTSSVGRIRRKMQGR